MLKRLTLMRRWCDADRTIGELSHRGEFIAYTMEPSHYEESPCVPVGFYYLSPHGWDPDTTLRCKRTWALVGHSVVHQAGDDGDGPGVRTASVFHQGVRDEHTRACVLLGLSIERSRGEPALGEAAQAMRVLRRVLGEAEPASLVIAGR